MNKTPENDQLLLFYEGSIWFIIEKYYTDTQSRALSTDTDFFSDKDFSGQVSAKQENKNFKRLKTFREKVERMNTVQITGDLLEKEVQETIKEKEEPQSPVEDNKGKDLSLIKGFMKNIISKNFLEKLSLKEKGKNLKIIEKEIDSDSFKGSLASSSDEEITKAALNKVDVERKEAPKKNFMEALTNYCLNVTKMNPSSSPKLPSKLDMESNPDQLVPNLRGATSTNILNIDENELNNRVSSIILDQVEEDSQLIKVYSVDKPTLSKAEPAIQKHIQKNLEEYEAILVLFTANLIIRGQIAESFKLIQKYGLNCADEILFNSKIYLSKNIRNRNYLSSLSKLAEANLHYLLSISIFKSPDFDFDVYFSLQEVDEAIKLFEECKSYSGLAISYLWKAFLISTLDYDHIEDEDNPLIIEESLELFEKNIAQSGYLPPAGNFSKTIDTILSDTPSEDCTKNVDIFIEPILKIEEDMMPIVYSKMKNSRGKRKSVVPLNKMQSKRKSVPTQSLNTMQTSYSVRQLEEEKFVTIKEEPLNAERENHIDRIIHSKHYSVPSNKV